MLVDEQIIKDALEKSKKLWNEQPYEIRNIMSISILREEIMLIEREKIRIKQAHKKEIKYLNDRILMLSKEIMRY